jgi:hypothetical protein
MRHFLTVFLTLIGLWASSQTRLEISSQSDTSTTSITTKLGIPFGTIAKLEVEVYDGDNLQIKSYEGTYVLKVNSLNDKKINDTILLTFIDETGNLANDNFGLYKLTYGKTVKSLTSKQISKLKEKYVGKKLTLIAYETGHFTGMPKDYFKYRPVRAARGFHFEHYLVVISSLTKQME